MTYRAADGFAVELWAAGAVLDAAAPDPDASVLGAVGAWGGWGGWLLPFDKDRGVPAAPQQKADAEPRRAALNKQRKKSQINQLQRPKKGHQSARCGEFRRPERAVGASRCEQDGEGKRKNPLQTKRKSRRIRRTAGGASKRTISSLEFPAPLGSQLSEIIRLSFGASVEPFRPGGSGREPVPEGGKKWP